MTRATIRLVVCGALVCLATATASAQTTTSSETKNFQVLSVDGNRLVVKLPEGTRELTVPDDFRFTVDGKSLSVRELKAGMTGSATITTRTTSTPVTVTEVRNGTVLHTAGNSIIVRTDEGVRMFTQADVNRRDVRIMREGRPAEIRDFRPNDRLTATIITNMPPKIMTEKEVEATLAQRPAAAAPPPASAPAAAPTSRPAPAAPPPAAAAPSAPAPRQLPKTASSLPVVGLAGLVSLAAGLGLTFRRRRATL